MARQTNVELAGEIRGIGDRVTNLEGWQKRQNGSIQRIERKVDRMIYLHFCELAMIIGGLVAVVKCLI